MTTENTTPQAVASVAEYYREDSGDVLFRVISAKDHGIVYIRRHADGSLTAETFAGRRLAEVPADAQAAVIAYDLPRG